PKAVGFRLELTPEPAVAWQGVVSLRLTHALDEHGQQLAQLDPSLAVRPGDPLLGAEPRLVIDGATGLLIGGPPRGAVGARLAPGRQPSRLLKEVRGTVTVQVGTTQTLLTVDDVAAAAGKRFAGPGGVGMNVVTVQRAGRQLTLVVRVSDGAGRPAAFGAGGPV